MAGKENTKEINIKPEQVVAKKQYTKKEIADAKAKLKWYKVAGIEPDPELKAIIDHSVEIEKSKATEEGKRMDKRVDVTGKETSVERKEISVVKYTFKQKYIRIMLLSIAMTFFIQYFILPTGIFLSGIEGTLNGITYALSIGFSEPLATPIGEATGGFYEGYSIEMNLINAELIYWILFSAYNTGILIWASKKIDKKYTILSTAYFITAAVTGLLLTVFNERTGFQILPSWDDMIHQSSFLGAQVGTFYGSLLYYLTIVFSVVFAVVPIAYITTAIYKLGGCADGFDPIGYYISLKSGADFGKMILYYTFGSVMFFMVLDYYILYNFAFSHANIIEQITDITGQDASAIESFLYPQPGWGNFVQLVVAPQLFGSLTYVFILTSIIDSRFPRNKKLSLMISSDKGDKIRFELLRSSYDRGFTFFDTRGGFNLKRRGMLNIVINFRELDGVVDFIHGIDGNAFITVNNVEEVYTKYWSDKIQEFVHVNEENQKVKFEEFDMFSSEKFNSFEERIIQDAIINEKLAQLAHDLNPKLREEIDKRIDEIKEMAQKSRSKAAKEKAAEQALLFAEDQKAILDAAIVVDTAKVENVVKVVEQAEQVVEHNVPTPSKASKAKTTKSKPKATKPKTTKHKTK